MKIIITGKTMTHAQLIQLLRREVERRGSQVAVATTLGISSSFLSDILHGKREPSAKILAALGLRRVVHYERIKE